MTKLKAGSDDSVARETAVVYRGREIVVELHPARMKIRLKGTREAHCLDYAVALECAMKVEARESGVRV